MARPTVETIERQFKSSWENVFQFYENYATEHAAYYDANPDDLPGFITRAEKDAWPDFRHWPLIKLFFETAMNRGFNKTLRAGTSLSTFIVSRSLNHGLRDEQPCIAIFFAHNRIVGSHNIEGETVEFTAKIEFDDTIDELFRRLEKQPLT